MRKIYVAPFVLILVLFFYGGVFAQDDITPDTVTDLTLSHTLTGHDAPINDLAFSPDGALLASASSDISTMLWDVTTGEQISTLEGQFIEVRSVDFSPTGRSIVTTGFNGSAYLWDIATQTRGGSFVWNAPFSDGEFSPDGEGIAFAIGDGAVRIYDALALELVQTLTVPDDVLLVERVSFSPDGTLLAAGFGFPADAVALWDVASGELQFLLEGHTNTVYGVDFSPDGVRLVSASGDGTLRLWDVATGESIWIVDAHPGGVFDVIFHPDGQLIASAGYDGMVKIWDAATGSLLHELSPDATHQSLLAVAFNPYGTVLAVAGENGVIWLWR